LEDFLAQNNENSASQIIKADEHLLERYYTENKNYEKNIELKTKIIKALNPNLLKDKMESGIRKITIALSYYRLGKNREATTHFDEGYEIYRSIPADYYKVNYDFAIAECLFYQTHYAKAEAILQQTVAFYQENSPPNDPEFIRCKELLEKIEANLKK
jgi:tetratricopeptide (TPR) repeat protein